MGSAQRVSQGRVHCQSLSLEDVCVASWRWRGSGMTPTTWQYFLAIGFEAGTAPEPPASSIVWLGYRRDDGDRRRERKADCDQQYRER